ncbi:MAG TPA: aspartate aminotransferase family protein [Candidatus Xenobia bacterium]|jgi:putrescine aminotransferase
MANTAQAPPDAIARVIRASYDHCLVGLADVVGLTSDDQVELSANGCYLTTADGTEYLDCFAGLGVFNLGHRHPEVIKAVTEQMNRMPLNAWTFFHNIPLAELAEALAAVAPGKLTRTSVFNSSSESMDIALKTARLATGRKRFIGCWEAYHGNTMGAQSVSGQRFLRAAIEPLLDTDLVTYGDIDSLRKVASVEHAAIVLEPIQGQVNRIPPPDYFRQVRALCDELGILLIDDETQTGLGRTGKLFGIQNYDVAPDLMVLGKALSGGVVPISVVMYTEEIANKLGTSAAFYHGTTFGGNELACAAAKTAIHVMLKDHIPEHVTKLGAYLQQQLAQIYHDNQRFLREYRGMGFVGVLEFKETRDAFWFNRQMLQKHKIMLFMTPRGDDPSAVTNLKIMPPLIAQQAEIDRLLQALRASFASLAQVTPAEFEAMLQKIMSNRLVREAMAP